MRKSVGLIALLMVAMAFVVAPPVAAEMTAPTTVEILDCGGDAPVIKCKWENDTTEWMEDGDTTHSTFGSQFDPTCDDTQKKEIFVYAVVTDAQGIGDITSVLFNVTGPCGAELIGQTCMSEVTAGALDLVNAANLSDLIHYYGGYDLDDVRAELGECPTAKLYVGSFEVDYCSPAGDYTVTVWAVDTKYYESDRVTNVFSMNRLACCEYDFTCINWGSIYQTTTEALVTGDKDMSTSDKPTVKNLGNIDIQIKVEQDKLSSGGKEYYIDNCGNTMYRFDAKILSMGIKKYFAPDQLVTLNGYIERCKMDGICFSLDQLNNGLPPGSYTGMVHIQCADSGNNPCP